MTLPFSFQTVSTTQPAILNNNTAPKTKKVLRLWFAFYVHFQPYRAHDFEYLPSSSNYSLHVISLANLIIRFSVL